MVHISRGGSFDEVQDLLNSVELSHVRYDMADETKQCIEITEHEKMEHDQETVR